MLSPERRLEPTHKVELATGTIAFARYLLCALINHAESSGVKLFFDQRATNMDFEKGTVQFQNEK